MTNTYLFIKEFLNRSGNYILISSIFSRLLSFFASWIALQLIPDKELGIVIYAFQIILFISPIASFGLNQSLIRYGAKLKSIEEKNKLFSFTLTRGLIICVVIAFFIVICSFFMNFEDNNTSFYIRLLSIAFITQFLFEILQIQFRLQKKNKSFAITEFTYNIVLVITVFLLSYFFKEFGYAIAIIATPLFLFLIFYKKLKINWKQKNSFDFINFSYFRYGFFASMSNVTTTLLISIDILLIGYLLSSMEMVTVFKYVSIIPYSLLFLSQVVITTDFVEFTEKVSNKKYIFNYIKNYITLFTIISLGCIVVILLFGKFFLSIFDPTYVNYFSTLVILTIGITGILILRGVFGNLLSAIGKAHVNFIVTTIAVILNVIFNYYLIPKYGVFGAAITSASLMWFTGVLCMILFFYHYKKEGLLNK